MSLWEYANPKKFLDHVRVGSDAVALVGDWRWFCLAVGLVWGFYLYAG